MNEDGTRAVRDKGRIGTLPVKRDQVTEPSPPGFTRPASTRTRDTPGGPTSPRREGARAATGVRPGPWQCGNARGAPVRGIPGFFGKECMGAGEKDQSPAASRPAPRRVITP
ncbi:hypothetical protein MTP06_34360 [Streptomyces sp. PLM4]|nr:hypothetical protein MTP06_34360 [Streptomyces sp. PLM4]